MFSFLWKMRGGFAAFTLVLAIAIFSAFTLPKVPADCPAPTGFGASTLTGGTVTLSWQAASGETGYHVWYERKNDDYVSSFRSVAGTTTTYLGLASGTYAFYLRSDCGQELSEFVILDEITVE